MIAVIGDTHLPRPGRRLPDACLRLLARADLIVHVGDFTAASILEELRALAPVAAVHGNVDEPALRDKLPARLVIEAEGRRLGLVHDAGRRAGRHARLGALFPECDAIVYGHSHLAEVTRYENGWILNPGSPTERRRAPTKTMIVLRRGRPDLIDLGT